jgi:hypothetical protein
MSGFEKMMLDDQACETYAGQINMVLATIATPETKEQKRHELRTVGLTMSYPVRIEGIPVKKALLDTGSNISLIAWQLLVLIAKKKGYAQVMKTLRPLPGVGAFTYGGQALPQVTRCLPLVCATAQVEHQVWFAVNEAPNCKLPILLGTNALSVLNFQLRDPQGDDLLHLERIGSTAILTGCEGEYRKLQKVAATELYDGQTPPVRLDPLEVNLVPPVQVYKIELMQDRRIRSMSKRNFPLRVVNQLELPPLLDGKQWMFTPDGEHEPDQVIFPPGPSFMKR